MAHFSEEAWADFARGVNDPRASAAINQHLLRNCEECTNAAAVWAKFTAAVATDRTFAVSQDDLRIVQLQFEAFHRPQNFEWPLANIVFDSISRPVMAGVRSGTVSPRQVVYEAEGLTVDLRFDRTRRSSKVCVVGQVLAKGSAPALHDASVILWTERGEPILAVKTTAFGEFQIEFEPRNDLRLSIEASGRRPIRIPLANLREIESCY